MQHTFSFEKLNAWQEAKLFAKSIYVLTKQFPDEEKFGLVSQMRRASISICSNIAEGTSRTSSKDQAYFYQMAYGSLLELLNQAIISNELTYLSSDDLSKIRLEAEKYPT